MGIWEIVVGALVLILSVIMIIVIILQEGHDAGLGTITGGADSFLKRGKAKTADALFARVTKYCAVTFFVLVVLLNALSYFGLTGKDNGKTTETETSVVSEVSTEGGETSAETSEQASEATESTAETSQQESAAESSAETSEQASEAAESTAEASEQASEAAESSAEG